MGSSQLVAGKKLEKGPTVATSAESIVVNNTPWRKLSCQVSDWSPIIGPPRRVNCVHCNPIGENSVVKFQIGLPRRINCVHWRKLRLDPPLVATQSASAADEKTGFCRHTATRLHTTEKAGTLFQN